MSNNLEKTPEELEQTLAMQLELLKKESEDLLKVGTVILAGALLTYGIVRATRKKKVTKTDLAMQVLEREGLLDNDIKKRLSKPKKSGFWPSFGQRLFLLGLALAKDKIINELLSPSTEVKPGEKSQQTS